MREEEGGGGGDRQKEEQRGGEFTSLELKCPADVNRSHSYCIVVDSQKEEERGVGVLPVKTPNVRERV